MFTENPLTNELILRAVLQLSLPQIEYLYFYDSATSNLDIGAALSIMPNLKRLQYWTRWRHTIDISELRKGQNLTSLELNSTTLMDARSGQIEMLRVEFLKVESNEYKGFVDVLPMLHLASLRFLHARVPSKDSAWRQFHQFLYNHASKFEYIVLDIRENRPWYLENFFYSLLPLMANLKLLILECVQMQSKFRHK